MTNRFLAAAVAALLLAGCSGGGTTTSLPNAGATGGTGAQMTPLSIRLGGGRSTSSTHRTPKYIPSDTNTLGIKVGTDVRDATSGAYTNSFGAESYYDVSAAASNANCKPNGDGSRTCTVFIAVQPGAHVALQFDAFKEPYATGFSANDPLATSTLEDQTVTAGQSATISVALNGVPATWQWGGGVQLHAMPTANLGASTVYPINVYDASGERIVGTYATPVTVTLHEVNGGGHLKIATVNGSHYGTPGNTAVLTSDSDYFWVAYDGWAGPANPDTTKPYYGYVTALGTNDDQPQNEINALFVTPSGYTRAAPDDLVVGGGPQSSTQFVPYEHGKVASDFTMLLSNCASGQFSAQGFLLTANAPGPTCEVWFKDGWTTTSTFVRSNGTPISITIH